MRKIVFLFIALFMATSFVHAQTAPKYRLKSMKATSSDSEGKSITFSYKYDLFGRLAYEKIQWVNNVYPDRAADIASAEFKFKYFEDSLQTWIYRDSRGEYELFKTYELKNGNIPHKVLKYKKGHLVSEKFDTFWGFNSIPSDCDKCTFNWEKEDVTSITFYKGGKPQGDLIYHFRDEACNSPFIYAHTFGMIYVPTAFCQECLFNHIALFHSGLPTPTRLLDYYIWPDGTKGEFKYVFDSNGNPIKVLFESTRFGDKFTLTHQCVWEEY